MKTFLVAQAEPTLTVGKLKNILADLPDDTQITIALNECDPLSEYANINQVEIPDFEESFSLILHAVDTFDARQF